MKIQGSSYNNVLDLKHERIYIFKEEFVTFDFRKKKSVKKKRYFIYIRIYFLFRFRFSVER